MPKLDRWVDRWWKALAIAVVLATMFAIPVGLTEGWDRGSILSSFVLIMTFVIVWGENNRGPYRYWVIGLLVAAVVDLLVNQVVAVGAITWLIGPVLGCSLVGELSSRHVRRVSVS